jgi:hypothetical protein
MSYTCNLCILFGYAFLCIDDKNHNISPFYGRYGTDDAEAFQLFLDLALFFSNLPCRSEHIPYRCVGWGIDCIGGVPAILDTITRFSPTVY